MNIEDKKMNNAAGGRHPYLSPRTEIIKMATNAGMMEDRSIRKETGLDGYYANGKQWQGDFDSWDDNNWEDSGTSGSHEW